MISSLYDIYIYIAVNGDYYFPQSYWEFFWVLETSMYLFISFLCWLDWNKIPTPNLEPATGFATCWEKKLWSKLPFVHFGKRISVPGTKRILLEWNDIVKVEIMTLYCVYIIACSEHGLYWWNKFGYPFGIINFLMNWCAKAHHQWRVVRTSPIGMNFKTAYITEFFCSGVTDTEQMYWIAEGLLEDIQRTSLTFHYKSIL